MAKYNLTIAAGMIFTLGACSDMSTTQERTLSGGALGAGAGLIGGAIAGNAGMGAAIGAGVGLAGGYLYDRHQKAKDDAYQQGVTAGKTNQ